MNSKDLIAAGRLPEARAQLAAEVKAAPSDTGKRALLFQVLAFLGEWEKAERHLDLIVTADPKSEIGAQAYKNVINAEKERKEVVERKRIPGFVTSVPAYLERYLMAWEMVNQGKPDAAGRLYEEIEKERPSVSGAINGRSFEGLWDTDAFLSCFLEAIVHDRYLWVPFEAIDELSVERPRTLFDLLWVPARLVTWEGVSLHCYLPVLYSGSSVHDDDRIKMGKVTDWQQLGKGFSKGMGQHVYQAGDEEISLLEIREALFTPPGKGE